MGETTRRRFTACVSCVYITMYKHARSVMFRLVKQVVVGRFKSRGVVPAIRKLLCGVFTVRGTAERRSHTELHV